MSSQKNKINKIFDNAQKYFDNRYHINLLPYLIAKKGERIYYKNISPDQEGNILLGHYAREYLFNLKNRIDEDSVFEWDTDCPEGRVLIKDFDSIENDFYNQLSSCEELLNDSFLKGQYPLRYFNLELRINNNQSIHFHQYISTSYQTSFDKGIVKLLPMFKDSDDKIKVVDLADSFTVGRDFDFVSFRDTTNVNECFTIISEQKPFEKLYNFLDQYKQAFDAVSKLKCVDLSNLRKPTEDCWRKCSPLLKNTTLPKCMTILNQEVIANIPTTSKKLLEEKQIPFKIVNGQTILLPETASQFKIVVKILSDKIVKTHYLQKDGLSDHIDVF